MSILEFQLFRIKFIKSNQPTFFDEDKTPTQIFLEALKSKPKYQNVNYGSYWHLGNLEIKDNSGYFAFGKTTSSKIEKYDENSNNFVEEDSETSPFTHVVFDAELGLIALSKKTKLSRTIRGLTKKLKFILDQTEIVSENNVLCLIDPIKNPRTFIQQIKDAYSILKFEAGFVGPNPFDADEYFNKPMSVYLKKANGEKGKTIIEGEKLNVEVIEEVTKSVASIGNEANARIQEYEDSVPKKIHLGSEYLMFSINDSEFRKQDAISEMRELYYKTRE